MRYSHVIVTVVALVAAAALAGCNEGQQAAQNGGGTGGNSQYQSLPSGSAIDITLATALTSETASVGQSWSGTVRNTAALEGQRSIAAGSAVSGTVAAVTPARKGDRAMLDLALTSINIDGRDYRVRGGMESVIAGSTRARNLGAIGAATVAGAVVGHQVGGSDKGTIIGGLVGGAAATGVVSQTKGWQVVLKPGTPLTFTTTQALAVRI